MLPEGLFPILDENHSNSLSCHEIIEALMDSEAMPFIVRNKLMSKQDYQYYIEEIDALKNEMDFDYIIHHHVDLYESSNALGVHLTSQSPSVQDTRKKFGRECIIGYSAHSLEEAVHAKQNGADYIFLGAIFNTPKPNPDHPVLGLETLQKVCRKIEIPIYAVGGINSENLILIRDAGAAGFSGFRAIYANNEIEHNVSKLGFMWEDLE